jgi:hypothetical protein
LIPWLTLVTPYTHPLLFSLVYSSRSTLSVLSMSFLSVSSTLWQYSLWGIDRQRLSRTLVFNQLLISEWLHLSTRDTRRKYSMKSFNLERPFGKFSLPFWS